MTIKREGGPHGVSYRRDGGRFRRLQAAVRLRPSGAQASRKGTYDAPWRREPERNIWADRICFCRGRKILPGEGSGLGRVAERDREGPADSDRDSGPSNLLRPAGVDTGPLRPSLVAFSTPPRALRRTQTSQPGRPRDRRTAPIAR